MDKGERLSKIDGHCHLFNLWYLISELVAAGRDAAMGEYPRHAPERRTMARKTGEATKERKITTTDAATVVGSGDLLTEIGEMIRRVSQLGRCLFSDYEGNYGLIQDKFKKAFPGEGEPLVFPLMMDIYYMFDGLFENAAVPAQSPPEDAQSRLSAWMSETRSAVHGIAMERAAKSSPHQGAFRAEIEKIADKFDELEVFLGIGKGPEPAQIANAQWPESVAMTPGFASEIR
jgi:hypothetical protein